MIINDNGIHYGNPLSINSRGRVRGMSEAIAEVQDNKKTWIITFF